MQELTPRQIVEHLDRYIVGQEDAKRAVAIAIRNRWRRQQLDDELRKEVAPKNILMIGPTGVGKTEISRRLADLSGAPFIKVVDEERELTVMLVVDVSASGDFGSHARMKGEVAVEICAVLAFSATTNNDKVGLIIFSDRIEKFVPPRKGRRHVLPRPQLYIFLYRFVVPIGRNILGQGGIIRGF